MSVNIGMVAAFCLLGLLGGGCSDETSAQSTGQSSTTGTGGAAGEGGAGGAEPLPPLDPEACPITAESGEDPAVADAAEAAWSPAYVAPSSGSIQQDKAFFLATVLAADAALSQGLATDPTLAAVAQDRDDRIRAAPGLCGEDTACYAQEILFSDSDIEEAGAAIVAYLETAGQLTALATELRESGRFALHAVLGDADLVRVAFLGLVVALGKTFGDEAAALGGPAFAEVVASVVNSHPEPFTFYEPLLETCLQALTVDKRDEAVRYEPLAEGENAPALGSIPAIDWESYPFTVILVPGLGPTSLDVPLSAGGQARCDLAAQRFEAKIAPLIALSGGHVHPDRTPYSEAIEMKKYLMSTYGIPEEALLVDPHARHTTTNLRNVSRLLYRYGVPVDKPLLVTSDLGQSIYIGHWANIFGPRCLDELGYLPWRSLVPISLNDSCMRPTAASNHADGRDPLDP